MEHVPRKLTKNEKKRQKAKEKKVEYHNNGHNGDQTNKSEPSNHKIKDKFDDIEIEYVSMNPLETVQDASILDQFKSIFEKFAKPEELMAQRSGPSPAMQPRRRVRRKRNPPNCPRRRKS